MGKVFYVDGYTDVRRRSLPNSRYKLPLRPSYGSLMALSLSQRLGFLAPNSRRQSWHPSPLVEIPQKAEKSKSPAKLCLVAVIGTTCQKGIWGIGGAIYTSFMSNITENSLNSFSSSVSPKETSSTFTTYALKLMASVSRDVTTQIYTHTAKPPYSSSKSQDSNQARICLHRFTIHCNFLRITAA